MNSILISLFNQAFLRSGGSIKAGPATCHQQLQLRKKLIPRFLAFARLSQAFDEGF
jgi:hypothetical protein